MGMYWQRQKLDMAIMKLLYEHRAVRGKTIVDMFSEYKQHTVYDRLRELRRMNLIDREQYNGLSADNSRKKRARYLGKVYFLTRLGVEQAKIHVYDTGLSGIEKSQKPEEKDIEIYWKASVLMSNLNIRLDPSRRHKQIRGYPMNLMIDLGYKEWSITFVRNNQETHRLGLIQLIRILETKGSENILLLCSNRPQYFSIIKFLIDNHAKGTYVLMQDDYINISRLLTGSIMASAIDTVCKDCGSLAEKLLLPVNGYSYKIGNEYANIFSLIGYPIHTMRRIISSFTPKAYVVLADEEQYKQMRKHFPKYVEKHAVLIAGEYIPEEKEIDEWIEIDFNYDYP